MRRFLALTVSAGLLLGVGCGGKTYDIRLNKTLEKRKYEKRLDDNLMPSAKGKLEPLLVYVRPPKNETATKEFLIPLQEPAQFDVAESFLEKDKQLSVLGRVKRKDAPKKKGAPKAAAPVARRDFSSEVVANLNAYYGVEIDLAKAKEVRKKDVNVFKHLTFEGNGKVVQLYLNVVKNNPYEVAMIFEYPKAEGPSLVSKIELCLESYATGDRARKMFSGGSTDEEEAAPPPGTAF